MVAFVVQPGHFVVYDFDESLLNTWIAYSKRVIVEKAQQSL